MVVVDVELVRRPLGTIQKSGTVWNKRPSIAYLAEVCLSSERLVDLVPGTL